MAIGRFIKVLHTLERYANIRAGSGNGSERESETQPQTCMATFNYILRRCVRVCVCQLHVYDKPSDRQLEKRRERGREGVKGLQS